MSSNPSQPLPPGPASPTLPKPATTDPPDPKDLDPKEKAKIDYQLTIDREKIQPRHGVRWQELMWDKGIGGLFIVLLGGLALLPVNCWMESSRQREARALEKYKLDEARQRFFLEKRLDALTNMAAAMSDVSRVFFLYTGEKKDAQGAAEEAAKEYDKALPAAREAINKSTFLFDVDFKKDTDRYYEIHRAIRRVGVTNCVKYRAFMAQLSREFDQRCQAVLHQGEVTPVKMTLADIPFESRDAMPPQQYLDAHFKSWDEKRARNDS